MVGVGRRWPVLSALLVIILLVCGTALIVGPVAEWLTPSADVTGKERAAALNATRQVLLTAVAGGLAIGGLAFTARTFFLSRRGQVADRYGKAMTQLASDQLLERIGGIYALEHLMHESDPNHATVVEVLAAFVREHATMSDGPPPAGRTRVFKPSSVPQIDVQSAMTVLGRRPRRPERHRIDLTGVELSGVELCGANLAGVDLTESRIRDGELSGAVLDGALLTATDLRGADLSGAHLVGAYLDNADLQGARLDDADLRDATLTAARVPGASFDGARLQGARLTPPDVKGLTAEQVGHAQTDARTELPSSLRGLQGGA